MVRPDPPPLQQGLHADLPMWEPPPRQRQLRLPAHLVVETRPRWCLNRLQPMSTRPCSARFGSPTPSLVAPLCGRKARPSCATPLARGVLCSGVPLASTWLGEGRECAKPGAPSTTLTKVLRLKALWEPAPAHHARQYCKTPTYSTTAQGRVLCSLCPGAVSKSSRCVAGHRVQQWKTS